jgi:hypothetical protein
MIASRLARQREWGRRMLIRSVPAGSPGVLTG